MCKCGNLVFLKKTAECYTCYRRRYEKENRKAINARARKNRQDRAARERACDSFESELGTPAAATTFLYPAGGAE